MNLCLVCVKVCETQEEMTIVENLEDISDLEVRWLQKTQQLKVRLFYPFYLIYIIENPPRPHHHHTHMQIHIHIAAMSMAALFLNLPAIDSHS